jgi:hypothetical protein
MRIFMSHSSKHKPLVRELTHYLPGRRRGSERPWYYVVPVRGELDEAGSQAQAIERKGTCENLRRSEKKVG